LLLQLNFLSDRTDEDGMYPSDVMSEVFQSLRLGGGLYFTARFGEGYAVAIPAEGRTIRFHLVREGNCWLTQGPERVSVLLHPGDLAIVPNGAGHALCDDPEQVPVPLQDVMTSGGVDPNSGDLSVGSGEASTVVLCGFCTFDEAVRHPAIDFLQDRLLLTALEQKMQPTLASAIHLLREEAAKMRAGRSGILSRLLEVIFIQAMRLQAERTDPSPGFMRALADENLSRVLSAVHRLDNPSPGSGGWNVEDTLFREVLEDSRRGAHGLSVQLAPVPSAADVAGYQPCY
jgi:hypothetical protein